MAITIRKRKHSDYSILNRNKKERVTLQIYTAGNVIMLNYIRNDVLTIASETYARAGGVRLATNLVFVVIIKYVMYSRAV